MKKFFAILLSFLFLLPSVGLHIDLKHCCGGVETIGISHQASVAVSECCDIQKSASCESSLELIVPQNIMDASLTNTLEMPFSCVLLLPFQTVLSPTNTHHKSEIKPILNPIEPPSQARLQVFLC
jgi:hypothetical protein